MTSELTWGHEFPGPDPSKVDNRTSTVAQMVVDRVAATPTWEAFRYPDKNENWLSVTWEEAGKRIKNLAAGLIALGIQPEQRVAIASATRYEWIIADFAVMCAGAATTTVYPTTLPDEVAYIVSDSESTIVFAEDDAQIKKLRDHQAQLSGVTAVITFDGTPDPENADLPVYELSDVEKRGEAHLADQPEAVDQAIKAISPESLATLIYTSGATGQPKGVLLTHDCWTYEGAAIDAVNLLTKDDLLYLWLPLAHSFGKVLLSAQLAVGFCAAVDGRVDKIVENMAIVKPAWVAAAPRIFEKAHARIVTGIEHEGGVKAKLFGWAFGVGLKVSALRQKGDEPGGALAMQHKLADKLVFSKIRERFGGRLRFFVSGAAGLNSGIAEWFHAAGILILEGYGLTETSAGSCVNLPGRYRFGTVGHPFPGTELKIADDGEILIRGLGVMRGYHNRPELTAEVLDADGWFHTGDIGELGSDGLLQITDRKKDLFKTSGGKYVAPQLIEGLFKAVCPYASQFLVHGEGRKFVSALVTLDPDGIKPWAEQNGLAGKSYEEIVNSDAAREMVQKSIDELNAKLNRWETIKKFVILDHDLTVEGGEITPSLKVKRKAVEAQYADVLEGLYA
jgi:long-chain acyl-CoA synthetase